MLRRISQAVTQIDTEITAIAERMFATMHYGPGAVGIAAIQIGEPLRIVTMDCSPRQKKSYGPITLINPEIIAEEGEKLVREGCLSLPNYLGTVLRAKRVTVEALDLGGEQQSYSFKGLEAICAQHEIDHLNGKLFIDRVRSLTEDVQFRFPVPTVSGTV